MAARSGQGSTLQVVAGILIVSILVLILFITQTTTSAETLEQSSQSSQAFMTNIHITNIISTSYYLQDPYDSITVGNAVSYWCKYGDNIGIIGRHQSDAQELFVPIEQVRIIPYLQDILRETIDSSYQLTIDCNPINEYSRQIRLGPTPPDNTNIYTAETNIPDQTHSHTIQVRLYTWN